MPATHEFPLVVLSVVIAVISSYTALDLAGRVTLTQGRARHLWLAGGAIAMGIGIWSMHFIGMLAYQLPIPVNYDPSIVLVSMVVAIVASGMALFVVSRQKMGWFQFLAGSIFMGMGVTSTHYVGMAAMRLKASTQYDPKLVTLSVVIAIGASLAALWLAFNLRTQTTVTGNLPKIVSAMLMGNAIAGVHYTGMAAVSFKPTDQPMEQPLHILDTNLLAAAIGIATLLILSLTLLTSLFDQRISAETETKVELRQANEQLRGEIIERQWAEEKVRFLQTITQAISESTDFHSALGVALRKVCDFTGWNFGEAWTSKSNGTTLECSPAWYSNNQNLEKFRQLSQGLTFPTASGLPKRVWSSRHPEWIQDFSTVPDTVFVRTQLVMEAGFKAGLGVPIIACSTEGGEPEVLAVLVFFMFESCDQDKRLVEIVSTVATQLGSVIQRKRAEAALRESEERFRFLVEGVKDYAIFMLDTDGHIVSWNTGAEQIKGYRAEEILGKHFSCFYPDENIALGKPEQELHLCKVNGQIEYEGWCVRKDGSRIWANVVITALRDQGGKLCGFSNVTRDITERKQAEEALRSSFATNRALLNAIPDLMFRISKDGTVVNFKAAKEDNSLVPASEFLGKNLIDMLPTDVAQPIIDCVERALETGDIQILEYQLMVNNNLLDYEARIVVSAEDETMAIVRDITERKRAEKDIRNALEKQKELSELKSRFVAMTSHEFRTPLTTILTSAELLEKYSSKLAEEKKLQHLHRIQAAVKQLTHLLNNVLLIGKAEAGKLQFKPVPLDLGQFCRDLVEELLLGTHNNQTIAFCSQGKCTTACMDEKLLLHILSNLLSNAVKYSPQSSTVHFDLICNQGEAIFQVQDQGIGIPAADQAELFNSFHRASNVGTISGTGLGLAIVKKSVDLHGGKIAVKSEVGVGTTFTVTLPLDKQV